LVQKARNNVDTQIQNMLSVKISKLTKNDDQKSVPLKSVAVGADAFYVQKHVSLEKISRPEKLTDFDNCFFV